MHLYISLLKNHIQLHDLYFFLNSELAAVQKTTELTFEKFSNTKIDKFSNTQKLLEKMQLQDLESLLRSSKDQIESLLTVRGSVLQCVAVSVAVSVAV